MIYEFVCPAHARFESYRPISDCSRPEPCPECGSLSPKVISMPAIKVITPVRLKYGYGSPGKILTRKDTGGLDVFIPSDGALEQEEVDYVAAAAIEKEQSRVKKKGIQRENQAMVQAYANLALSTPPGKRRKVLQEAAKQEGVKIRR